MPAKPAVIPLIVRPGDLIKTKQDGLAVLTPLQSASVSLTIRTEADYQVADAMLAKVRTARKTWGDRMERIIRPMRTALDEVYGLNRDVDRPLEAVETTIKQKMKVFKLEEQRVIQETAIAQQAEADRLRREAEEKEALAAKAKTAQMRGKLAAQQERLQERIIEVESQPIQAPVQANSSTTRPAKIIRVKDLLAFCGAIADGAIPHDIIEVKQGMLNKQYKDNPEEVAQWPGVTIEDDIQILGR